jgi:hypothetical protein
LVRAEGGGSKTRQNRLVVASLSFHRHRAGGDVKKAILKHALKEHTAEIAEMLREAKAEIAFLSLRPLRPLR